MVLHARRIAVWTALLIEKSSLFAVRTADGTLSVAVQSTDSVSVLRQQLCDRKASPLGSRLLFGGLELLDERRVGDYGLQDQSTVDVALPLFGGGGRRKSKASALVLHG